MSGLEPGQYGGVALAGAGVIALIGIRFATKMAFRSVKLLIVGALVIAGGFFFVNGGADDVQQRIDDVREDQGK